MGLMVGFVQPQTNKVTDKQQALLMMGINCLLFCTNGGNLRARRAIAYLYGLSNTSYRT